MKSQAQNKRPDIADAEDTASSPELQQCNVVRRFFNDMSKKHNVDLDSLNVHITNGDVYVSKYTPGHINMFSLLEILK